MPSKLDTLTVGLRGSYGGLSKDLDKAAGLVKGFGSRVGGLLSGGLKFGGIAAGLTAALGGIGLGAMIDQQRAAVDATSKLADRLGVSTEALTGLTHAADLSGVSAEGLNKGLEKMLQNLGQAAAKGGPVADVLSSIGLNAGALAAAKPEAAFSQIADALKAIQNPAERAYAATQISARPGNSSCRC